MKLTSTTFVKPSLDSFLSEVQSNILMSLYSVVLLAIWQYGNRIHIDSPQVGGCFGLWLGVGVVQAMQVLFKCFPAPRR